MAHYDKQREEQLERNIVWPKTNKDYIEELKKEINELKRIINENIK